MSVNLGSRACALCHYPEMVLSGKRRKFQKEGRLSTVKVRDASCPICGAKYVAWVDGFFFTQSNICVPVNDGGFDYTDLSFRSTQDEEPGEYDKPTRRVRRAWVDEEGSVIEIHPEDVDK